MAKKTRKRLDFNQIARKIVDQATAEQEPEPLVKPAKAKDAAAVRLGRLGGKKGGKARASKLSAERRAEIAKMAAAARWKRQG